MSWKTCRDRGDLLEPCFILGFSTCLDLVLDDRGDHISAWLVVACNFFGECCAQIKRVGHCTNLCFTSPGQCCICKFIRSCDGIKLSFRFVMIQSDPTTTRKTMSMPNASASTLLVLSDPVVMCRKKTR